MQRHCHSVPAHVSFHHTIFQFVRFGFSFETYFASDFSMNTEYTCRMNNKWDRFGGFHACTAANGFSRSSAAVGNDLEHPVAENNHLTVASMQWCTLVEPGDDKNSISASISLIARLAARHAAGSSSFQVLHFSCERKLFSSRITRIAGSRFLSPRITDCLHIPEEPCDIVQANNAVTDLGRKRESFLI